MPWFVPVILCVLIGYVLIPLLLKKVTNRHSRTKRLAVNFGFCALIAGLISLVSGIWPNFDQIFWAIFAVGAINGFAAYCYWRAVDVSMSKNSLFMFWDDLIAMSLSYAILKEGRFLNLGAWVGIVISVGAVITMVVYDYRKKETDGPIKSWKVRFAFYGFALSYSVIWGLAVFLERYWGVLEVPSQVFLLGWYTGSAVMGLLIHILATWALKNQEPQPSFHRRDYVELLLLSSGFLSFMWLAYLAYQEAPQMVVQPIFLVAQMVLPSLIGLYVFREIKQFSKLQKVLLVVGLAGGILVAISYSGV